MRSIAILQQMGIPVWQLRVPQSINATVNISIPPQCRLLLIASLFPTQDDIELLQKIVRSIGVEMEEVFYLSSEQLQLISAPQALEWIWFCGEEPCLHSVSCDKELVSHPLSSLQHNPLFKKQLWQQIKTLKEA